MTLAPDQASASPSRAVGMAVETEALTKTYGDVEAVRGIDLQVPTGELFGFLGPNGAGKSTTIQILCTLLHPTSGTARVAGFDVMRERDDVRRHIGLVFQEPTLDQYLTAEQNLRFHADIYGLEKSLVADRIDAVLDLVGLADRRRSLVRTFSGGMKRRLEIARGLLHSPRVFFMDEPTIGLDPESRSGVWQYVDELRSQEDITVFLTTHYMDEAERCDRIAIIDSGRIAAIDAPAALKGSVGSDTVRLESSDNARLERLIADRTGARTELLPTGLNIYVPDGERFVPELFALGFQDAGLSIRSVSVQRPSLDDVFLAYTGNRFQDRQTAASRGGQSQ